MNVIQQTMIKSSSLSLSLSLKRLKSRFNLFSSNSGFTPSTPLRGFTIVELLVVIVVIGILAAITIVAYTGITNRAIVSSLQSDLTNANSQLKLFQVDNMVYPITINCAIPDSSTNKCLKASSGNTLTYQPNPVDYLSYNLYDTNTNGTDYRVTDNNQTALLTSLVCPLNFIVVPGSSTYGTSDFCVMKYGAKQYSATVPISQAAGLPWTSISQTTSVSYSPNVAGCTGCHLITEAEYLTIVQNVLNVASNWSTGTVGSGYIYSGHNDNAPANAIAADTSDNNGYAGTGNNSTSGANQKRTLTLSNGEVIWDLAGNVWEWTAGTSTTGQPGVVGNAYASWIEWPNVTTPGTLSPSVFPSGTGISGASSWNSSNGIGQLISNPAETGLRGFFRGGAWFNGGIAGVLALILNNGPSNTHADLGFRVSR